MYLNSTCLTVATQPRSENPGLLNETLGARRANSLEPLPTLGCQWHRHRHEIGIWSKFQGLVVWVFAREFASGKRSSQINESTMAADEIGYLTCGKNMSEHIAGCFSRLASLVKSDQRSVLWDQLRTVEILFNRECQVNSINQSIRLALGTWL